MPGAISAHGQPQGESWLGSKAPSTCSAPIAPMTTTTASLLEAAFMQSWNAIVITDADAAQGYRVQMPTPRSAP